MFESDASVAVPQRTAQCPETTSMHILHSLAAPALLTAALLIAGCTSSVQTPDPVGPGPGLHDLKLSPCACMEIPQRVPDHFRDAFPPVFYG